MVPNLVRIPTILVDNTLEVLKRAGAVFKDETRFCKTGSERRARHLDPWREVELPAGWTLKCTYPGYYTLYDDKDRERASVMAKGCSWDVIDERMSALPRYQIHTDEYNLDRPSRTFSVHDGRGDGPVVYTSSALSNGFEFDKLPQNPAYADCAAWLDATHPEWRDASAYWD